MASRIEYFIRADLGGGIIVETGVVTEDDLIATVLKLDNLAKTMSGSDSDKSDDDLVSSDTTEPESDYETPEIEQLDGPIFDRLIGYIEGRRRRRKG